MLARTAALRAEDKNPCLLATVLPVALFSEKSCIHRAMSSLNGDTSGKSPSGSSMSFLRYDR